MVLLDELSSFQWDGAAGPSRGRANQNAHTAGVRSMKLARSDIVDMLRENGDVGSAHQAEANLPEVVDTDTDHDALAVCGVDVDYLLALTGKASPTER